jgi:predicted  nucleic acid-binding Zn-ribbon protein
MKQRHLQQRDLDLVSNGETIGLRKNQQRLNLAKLAELDTQIKQISVKSTNSPIAAYNKIKSLITEKENEKVQLRIRIKKLNDEAISNKTESA